MKKRTKATNISLSPAIEAYLDKKLAPVEKFFEHSEAAIADIELGRTTNHHKSGDVFRAEVMITDGGNQYRAVADTEDLYASIDKVKDELLQELKMKMKRKRTLFRHGAAKLKNILKGLSGRD
jgi:ribosomal subunit interface protein